MSTLVNNNPFFKDDFRKDLEEDIKNNELFNIQQSRVNYIHDLFSNYTTSAIINEIVVIEDIDLFLRYLNQLKVTTLYKDKFKALFKVLLLENHEYFDNSYKHSLIHFTESLFDNYIVYYQEIIDIYIDDEKAKVSALLKLEYSEIIDYHNLLNKYVENEDEFWKKFSRYKTVKLSNQEEVINKLFAVGNYETLINLVTYNFFITGIIYKNSFNLLLQSLYLVDPSFEIFRHRLGKMQRKTYENVTIEDKVEFEMYIITHLNAYKERLRLYCISDYYITNPKQWSVKPKVDTFYIV